MEREIKRIYEFGKFAFDAQTESLKYENELVQLPPKSLSVLAVLIESRGDVVTRERLLDTVWDDAFVEDGSLTVAISALRKTFEELDGDENYIQTIARKGYRFTAEVEEKFDIRDEPIVVARHSREELTLLAQDQQLATATRTKYLRPVIAAVAIAIAVIGGIFAYRTRSPKPFTTSEIKTIAVLPFEDLSAAPSEKYLGVSLADALAKQFGDLKHVTVRPIQSVLKYENTQADAQAVGRELQVDAVLDGRIQRVGDRLRVSVQLIRTSDNAMVWTDNFDDAFTNFFVVQDSISKKIATSLTVQIDENERRRFEQRGTANPEAYQAYLRGRYFWNRRDPEGFQKAIEQFEQAVQKDPSYALAYTGLADCYQLLAEYGVTSPKEAFPKAKEAANRALELDPNLAEAHTSLAYAQAFYDWDWPAADSSFKRALDLNPNYATAHQWYAEYLVVMGRFDEAKSHIDRALQIDPVSLILLADLAAMHHTEGNFDRSIEESKQIISTDPNFAYGYYYLAVGYTRKAMNPEAVAAYAQLLKLFGEPADCLAELDQAFASGGMPEYWKKRIEQIQTRPHLKNLPAFNKAFVYAQMGDKDAAFQELEKSYANHERLIINAKYAPDFEMLRQEPRFQTLIKQIGL